MISFYFILFSFFGFIFLKLLKAIDPESMDGIMKEYVCITAKSQDPNLTDSNICASIWYS